MSVAVDSVFACPGYRLMPTPAQQAVLRDHCGHARYVWNLAVEQHAHCRPDRASAPGYLEQCRQLTEARAEHPWLAEGSQTVQQQALRDFAQARAAFVDRNNPARRPSWRKAGQDEGFRITGRRGRQWDVRRVSRRTGQVWIPKAGWVRFRWSRPVPPGLKSYRVRMDRAGRWHVAFAVIPEPIPAPGNGQVVGIDRGVTVSAALSTGELAPSRVEKIKPAYTSQRCSACGRVDADSRESQPRFACTACGYACNADVNAAQDIAAGHAVTARGGCRDAGPVNREPQLLAS
jgi:transposase